jgi:hypothetical protein
MEAIEALAERDFLHRFHADSITSIPEAFHDFRPFP